jgi:hypothetical protein
MFILSKYILYDPTPAVKSFFYLSTQPQVVSLGAWSLPLEAFFFSSLE